LKPNTTLFTEAANCPSCQSKDIESIQQLSKKVIDLKLSNQGVKRWTTHYKSYKYKCLECEINFIPEQYPKSKLRIGRNLIG